MNAPGFREHCTKRKRKASHQQPSTRCADVRECCHTAESAIHSEKDNAQVGQHASDDNQIIQMRTRHFDVALVSELDVDDEKTDGKHDSQYGTAGKNDVDCQVDLRVLYNSQCTIFWWRTTDLKSFTIQI